MPSRKRPVGAPVVGSLHAWITPTDSHEFVAAFVGSDAARQRAPATQLCASPTEAEQWIKAQADALGLPVDWVAEAPRG
jgi:hypothetical protein